MSGAGNACPVGRFPIGGGAPPPGLFGIAGAGRPPVGGGGGPRPPALPTLPTEPCRKIKHIVRKFFFFLLNIKIIKFTCCTGGAFLRGPPGLGGESLGFSPVGSQSFLTGGGTGVENVAMETSPKSKRKLINNSLL